MIDVTEIRVKGMDVLSSSLGSVESERFVALLQREPFDYPQWQRDLFSDRTVAELSSAAMRFRNEKTGSCELPRFK